MDRSKERFLRICSQIVSNYFLKYLDERLFIKQLSSLISREFPGWMIYNDEDREMLDVALNHFIHVPFHRGLKVHAEEVAAGLYNALNKHYHAMYNVRRMPSEKPYEPDYSNVFK